jgi:transposase
MPSSAAALLVSADDQAVLRRWANATLVRRAWILLLAAEGVANTEVATTLAPPPEHLGATHWSTRLLAEELGCSHSTIARVWAEHNVKPWQAQTCKCSTDPQLEAKLRDVVGLYLDPPEHAIVVCVDEKSQIQALERTQAVRAVKPGRPDPGRQLRVVCDNYTAHKHARVRAWLVAHPRVHLHFTPTYASWLNLVEVFFSVLERQALRRGEVASVEDLMAAIRRFVAGWVQRCQPFVWTKDAEQILTKLKRGPAEAGSVRGLAIRGQGR